MWEGKPGSARGRLTFRLALGGGFGYLSGQYGMVVDNMLGATVVVANGTILHCSATENKDVRTARPDAVSFFSLSGAEGVIWES